MINRATAYRNLVHQIALALPFATTTTTSIIADFAHEAVIRLDDWRK